MTLWIAAKARADFPLPDTREVADNMNRALHWGLHVATRGAPLPKARRVLPGGLQLGPQCARLTREAWRLMCHLIDLHFDSQRGTDVQRQLERAIAVAMSLVWSDLDFPELDGVGTTTSVTGQK